jgi:hypothetical protein
MAVVCLQSSWTLATTGITVQYGMWYVLQEATNTCCCRCSVHPTCESCKWTPDRRNLTANPAPPLAPLHSGVVDSAKEKLGEARHGVEEGIESTKGKLQDAAENVKERAAEAKDSAFGRD